MLTDYLRLVLKDPLGALIPNEERTRSRIDPLISHPLVLIGDITASVMTGMGFTPQLIIIDNHTKRGRKIPALLVEPSKKVVVKNPAGMLGGELFEAVEEAVRVIIRDGEELTGPVLIEVQGEEDLSTLAAIELLPDGATVVYGQPDSGLVFVTVEKGIRKKIEEMLREMEV